MAKNKEKRSSSAAIDSSKGLASANPPTEKSDQDFISLDAGAIANLTQQIERRLKGGTEAGKKKPLDQSSQQRSNKKEKANFPQKTEGTQKSNKGKKRDRHGDVIQEQVKGGKAIPSEPRNDDTDKLLEQEILALGGNKEDLDLLAGVDSDSEVDESSRGDNVAQDQSLENALRKELAGFLKDAGKFNPVIADEEEDEGEDSEQEDGGIEEETGGVKIKDLEDGGSEMDEPSESPTIEVSAKDQPKKERSGNQDFSSTASAFPKEYSKLVCSAPPG
jgi:ribosome biogenesis protein MAK21